jgi:hypothetical protein
MKSTDFVVARHDLPQCKFIESQLPEAAALPDDALLVKIDRFAFTANNITYAVTGDQLKYWQLSPAPENFGNIPVWGFGALDEFALLQIMARNDEVGGFHVFDPGHFLDIFLP